MNRYIIFHATDIINCAIHSLIENTGTVNNIVDGIYTVNLNSPKNRVYIASHIKDTIQTVINAEDQTSNRIAIIVSPKASKNSLTRFWTDGLIKVSDSIRLERMFNKQCRDIDIRSNDRLVMLSIEFLTANMVHEGLTHFYPSMLITKFTGCGLNYIETVEADYELDYKIIKTKMEHSLCQLKIL